MSRQQDQGGPFRPIPLFEGWQIDRPWFAEGAAVDSAAEAPQGTLRTTRRLRAERDRQELTNRHGPQPDAPPMLWPAQQPGFAHRNHRSPWSVHTTVNLTGSSNVIKGTSFHCRLTNGHSCP